MKILRKSFPTFAIFAPVMLAALVAQTHAQPAFFTTGPLTAARYHHAATLLPNGKVLVSGGYSSTGGAQIASAELFDPAAGTWTATGPMANTRFVHTTTLLTNGLVLVVGGFGSGGYLSSAELYNPATGLWTATGALNSPRYDHTATLLPNGKVLVAGGNGPGWLSTTEIYDPVAGTWTTTGSLTTARVESTATLLTNGLVMIAGGRDSSGNSLASAELYNPASGTWAATGKLNAARAGHVVTVLSSGLVLVAGGYGNFGAQTHLATADIYNPATGTWSTTGSLNTARQYATATKLPSGLVVIAGGNNGTQLASVELFSPVTGTWTNASGLQGGRYFHTATLLNDGRALLVGGQLTSGTALSTAELFTEPPAITGQPTSVTPGVGASVAFNATVTGSGLAYQWVKDGVALPGANTITLTFPSVHPVNIGNYALVVTNATGSVTSSIVSLTIPGIPTGVWQGLVAYYPFNGNANDEGVNGNNGTVNGAATATNRFGTQDAAYSFNGTSGYISAANRDCLRFGTNDFTFSVWAADEGSGSQVYMLGMDNGAGENPKWIVSYGDAPNQLPNPSPAKFISFAQSDGGGLTYFLAHTPYQAGVSNWHQYLFTKSGTNYSLFIDGIKTPATNYSVGPASGFVLATGVAGPATTPTNVTAPLTIGWAEGGGYFKGKLDDIRIYNRALSSNDVAQLYASEAVAPVITTQPTSASANVGSSATFTVTAAGTNPLSYQWLKDGLAVPSATSATLTLNTLQTNQAGGYSVVITNAAGSITSSVVTLTVNRLSQTITFGALAGKRVDDVPFSLSATASSGLAVSFGSSDAAVATVGGSTVTITGIGSTTITATQAGDATYLAATSVNRTLAVAGIPPGISSQPTGLTVNVTATAAFGVTATGTAPLSYQWRKDGVDIGGATGATLGLVNVQTNQAGNYSVVVTNTWGSITSSVVALTVNRLVQTITFGPLAGKRVDDGPFSLAATANSGLAVSFSSSVTSVATVSGSTVTITGVGSTTITASQSGDATYLPATSVPQTLVVSAPPSIGTPPAGQSFTLGSAVTLSVSAGGTGPLSYQWQFNGVNIAGATGATLALSNLSATNAGAYRVVITNAVGTITSIPVDLYFYGDLKFIAATVLAGSIGQQYRVDYADVVTIGTTNWLVLTNITLPSSPFLVIDPASSGKTQRYYRAVPLQ